MTIDQPDLECGCGERMTFTYSPARHGETRCELSCMSGHSDPLEPGHDWIVGHGHDKEEACVSAWSHWMMIREMEIGDVV